MKVHVVPPDPRWRDCFDEEAASIRSALGELPVWVHHIGSTSIPNIHAKPVIDILLEVADIEELDGRCSAFESLGYEAKGEFGIPGRRYFRKDSESGVRTHQIHAFESSSEGLVRHLAFRDYLIAHPVVAQEYSELKKRLSIRFSEDIEAYMDGKDAFIKEHEQRALRWRETAPCVREDESL
jgi:GrpB-like predicted nucleotidyltransferase (UPF0157 family)